MFEVSGILSTIRSRESGKPELRIRHVARHMALGPRFRGGERS
jgi:hypothetical protein